MFGFVVIGHGRREILHINVTRHPSAEWLQQRLSLAFPEVSHLRFLLLDNDVLFQPVSDPILQLTRVKTQIASP